MEHKIALVFDFDDTLMDDSTSGLLRKNDFTKEDVDRFWKQDVEEFVDQGWEPTLAWLHAFLS